MAVRTLLSLFLVATVARAGPGDERDPKDDPAFWKRVHTSLDKGVDWLLDKQSTTGQFPAFEDQRGISYELGMHALSLLAVMKGTGDVERREVLKGLRVLRTLVDRHRARLYTYEVGITLMA